jgi:hypothetical protein
MLADGHVAGDNLICSLHGWDYVVQSGISAYDNHDCLEKFDAWVEDDQLYVDAAQVREWAADLGVPTFVGSSQRALAVSQTLLERGINARPILYPAVRESAARVRFFLTSEHSEDDIVRAVETLAEVMAAMA